MIIRNARILPTRVVVSDWPPDEPFLSVILKATFALESSPTCARLSPKQLPILECDVPWYAESPGKLLRFESDCVPFKPRTDIVLIGDACVPHGRSARTLDVEIRVGATSKVLRVFGERRWSMVAGQRTPILVGPAGFVRMPLTYDRAFGGVDEHARAGALCPGSHPWYAKNPHGRGYVGARTVESIHNRPLANIEDPANPITAWDTCPFPAGCGFFPRGAETRLRHAGIHAARWKTEKASTSPPDFAFDFYNGAHPDLQTPNYLVGNEVVQLKHVDPDVPILAFQLPCWSPRLQVRWRASAPVTRSLLSHDAPFRLDTLVFIPPERCFYQVWRARMAVKLSNLDELEALYIDYESLSPGQSPPAAASRGGSMRLRT
jgi:hypothetical protein